MTPRFCRGSLKRFRFTLRRMSWLAAVCVCSSGVASAQSNSKTNSFFSFLHPKEFRPDNVVAAPEKTLAKCQRVAVLPLAAESASGELPDGCTSLTPVVWEEVVKSKRFEAVTVDADKLRAATGRAQWTGTETLPANLLEWLHREYGCDAVLFGEVTTYRAYAPLAVGWRFKLVDVQTGKVIWAADEIFDAADKKIAKAAQKFAHPGLRIPLVESPDWAVLNSPRKFGRFSAAALLETLPQP
jgi:hypothetical protein